MSSLSKMLSLLDLFSPTSLVVSADTMMARTGMSKATVYRYAKDLCDAGLLTRAHSGSFSLGPRIIELDWLMRQYDPILIAGRELMHELSEQTRLAVHSSVFYDDRIINTYIVEPSDTFAFDFGRGQPLPLFRGAQSKVLVAYQKGRRLERLFREKIANDPNNINSDLSWSEFTRTVKNIRKDGYCMTVSELTSGLAGVASPILSTDGKEAVASLCLVGTEEKFSLFSRESIIARVVETAQRIASRLESQIAAY